MRRFLSIVAAVIAGAGVAAAAQAQQQPTMLIEPPLLAATVKSGELPPVDKRVPTDPAVVPGAGAKQQYGGEINTLMERAADIKRMSAFGYARLVGYSTAYRIEPDLLSSFEVEAGRVFTLHLRKGHRWSDGKPFTTEDFRYFWEDMILNPEMTPEGPPNDMMVDGKPPKVEIVDKETIRYSWDSPNPFFLPALAGATPLMIYRPAHYLRRYHKRYADPAKLQQEIAKRNRRDWVDLHFNRDRTARLDNPEVPVLDPWRNTTPSPAERFVFERNPYYHRVDSAGRQLPYIDRVVITIAASKLIPAKVGAGEATLQSRALQFNNYTVLKRAEAREHFKVRLWPNARCSQVALYPNLNVSDETWRGLNRDVRFRRALSLAIDRREINMVLYYGLARESANTILQESALFRPAYQAAWARFDLAEANRLLDEIGLARRDSRGVRLMRDGRPLEIIVETSGEGSEYSDVLELIRDTWAKAGVALFIKPQTREVMARRVRAGLAVMSVFFGYDNGIPNADTPPSELAPTLEAQLQWPLWGMWYGTRGRSGEEPSLPEVRRLAELIEAWKAAPTDERARIWTEMLEINSDQVYSIGTINAVPQPVVVSERLHNVPERALYAWEPGGHFGVFRPDTFWLADVKQGS